MSLPRPKTVWRHALIGAPAHWTRFVALSALVLTACGEAGEGVPGDGSQGGSAAGPGPAGQGEAGQAAGGQGAAGEAAGGQGAAGEGAAGEGAAGEGAAGQGAAGEGAAGQGAAGEGAAGEGAAGEGAAGEGAAGQGAAGEGAAGEGAAGGGGEVPDPEPEPAPDPNRVRFIAIGDVGKGNDGQRRVGLAIADACEHFGGCDFVLMAGDNIYEAGVRGPDDPEWIDKFEEPYAAVDVPFYATLGNHDYGAPPILEELAGGIGIDPTRGQAQLDYAARQDKFRMPDLFYRFARGPVEFVSLNTATMFWRDLPLVEGLTGFADVNEAQEATLPQWADNPLGVWRIAWGHHPYLSNGPHGNAGDYDGVFIDGLIGSGTALRDFFEGYVVGEFDVLISGHDHSLQDVGDVDGTTVIVTGAGASTTDLEDRNPVIWEAAERGFVLFEADRRGIDFRFLVVPDDDGAARPWFEAHRRQIFR